MGVEVSPIANGNLVAEQMIRWPGHYVRLANRYIGAALGATVRLLGPMRGNVSHEPFATAQRLLPRSPIGESRDVTLWALRGSLIFIRAASSSHGLPPVVGEPEVVCSRPATVPVGGVAIRPAQVVDRVVAATGYLAAGKRLDQSTRAR